MDKNQWIFLAVIGLLVGLLFGYWFGQYSEKDYHANMMNGGGMMGGMQNMHGGEGMEGAMGSMMSDLSGKQGKDFDQAFLSQMIMHHEGAVMMAEAALRDAEREEIKNMARDIISAQSKEIDMMEKWERDWFGR